MRLQQGVEILCVNHISRSDHHVIVGRILDLIQVCKISLYVCIIIIVLLLGICKHHLYISALGVDVEMTAGSDVAHQRLRSSADVDLNPVDAAVGHIGDGEVNHAVSAKEGECGD